MNHLDELNARLGIGSSRPRLPITLQRSGYTAVRQLGKGSFGNAYLVYNAERKEHYVVKHVNMANMTPRQRKDAHQEIAVLQQLEYPNIVRYVEFFEEFPHLYIVMEYADGGDVYTHLKNLKRSVYALGGGGGGANGGTGGLTEEQVISLFVQTTMAVKYMHDRRLLHRDIKSQNVFLTQGHVVKLGDFGISTVLISTVAMAQTMCGTPCYFSPELCEGKPYNNKSDVWALGVFLYELCTTGRLPFEAVTMNRLMNEICKKEPRRIPANFSDELWSLVRWMLSKEPGQRPDAGQILRSPVLVRAIPDLIKKLSATDKRCEREYRRLFSLDAIPLPPIRVAELQQKHQEQQQQQRQQRGAGGSEECNNKLLPSSRADAVISAAGAGRFNIFRKGNDEYPFRRVSDVDPLKKLFDGVRDMSAQRQQPSKNTEAVNAPSNKAVPANKPLLAGDHLRHSPIHLQDKINKEEDDSSGNAEKGNNNSNGERNANAHAVNHYLEGFHNRYVNKRKLGEQPVEAKAGHLPTPAPAPAPAPTRSETSVGKAFGNIPLKELFLIYDERKKRIENDREQRLKLAGGKMNYQSGGKDPFRGRPAAVEKKPEYCVPQKNFLQMEPRRVIEKSLAAVPVEDKANKVSSSDSVRGVETGADKPCETGQHFRGESKCEENDENRELSDKDDGTDEIVGPPSELALVLREMTNHFKSVQSGVFQTREGCQCGVATGTPSLPNLVSAASASSTGSSLVGESKQDEEDVGQEFADVMGTTLDVKKLQQQTAAPGSIADVGHAEDGEPISLLLVRNDALRVPCANPQLSVQVGGFKESDRGSGKGKNWQSPVDAKTPESLSVACASPVRLDADAASVAATGDEGDPVFECTCLCGGVHFCGLASTIFGSFVCNCVVCTRFSGAIVGLEWLHLPDVQFEDLFVDPLRASSSPAVLTQGARLGDNKTPVGCGVVAGQAHLAGAPPQGMAAGEKNARNKEGRQPACGGATRLPPLLSKYIIHVPLVEEDGTRVTGTYTTYFCSRCGTTLGMDHNDVSGAVVAKGLLSDASLAILESFQQTMLQSTAEVLSAKR